MSRPGYGYKAAIVFKRAHGGWHVDTDIMRGARMDSCRTFPTHAAALAYAIAATSGRAEG